MMKNKISDRKNGRMSLFFAVCAIASVSWSGTFTWTGAANDGNKWSTAQNWLDESSAPGAPSSATDVVLFDVGEDVTTDFDLTVSPVIVKRGAGKLVLRGEKKYENATTTGSLFLYEGSIDLGGGKASAFQPSRYSEAVIGGNTSIDNGIVSYDGANIKGADNKNEYVMSAGCLAFKEGVFKIGPTADFTINKALFSFSSDAAEVTGERTLLVDGGKLTVKGSSYVIGCDNDWSKAAVLDIRNNATVNFGNGLCVGARFSNISSEKAAGYLRVNDSTVSGGQWFILTVANENGTQGSRAVAAFTNSVLSIMRPNLGIEVNNFSRSSSDTHLIFNNTIATLSGINVYAQKYTGTAEIEGRRTEDGQVWTGVMTLDSATLKPIAHSGQFIFNKVPLDPTVELLEGGGIIDTEFDVTVPVVAFGPGGWTKRGGGRLILSGDNLYRGATRVENGVLELAGSVAGVIEAIGGEFSTAKSSKPFSVILNGGKVSFNALDPVVVDALAIGENGGVLSLLVKGSTINNVSGLENLSKLEIEAELGEWGLGELMKSDSPEFLERVCSLLSEKVPDGIELSVSGSAVVATGSEAKVTTWTGLGEDSLWTTEDNWSDGRPAVFGPVVFGTSEKTDAELNNAVSLSTMEFSSVAPSYSVSGNGSLTMIGGLTNSSANVQTFNVPVVMSGAESPVHAVGDVAFAGGIDGLSIVKTGSGNAIFSSSYNGRLAIREGGVVLAQDESKNLKLSEKTDFLSLAGLLDLGGGSLAINQSENGECVFKDGAVLKNGSFTYSCPRKVWNSSNLNGTALIWNEGTITVGDGAVFSPAGQLFAYGPSAPAETHGERRILVDGGELVLGSGTIYIIGVDNDWSKGAIVELANGGRLVSNNGDTIMIGARNNGSGTSKAAKGLLVATDGSLIDVNREICLLNPAGDGHYGRIALTNSTMIIRSDKGLNIKPIGLDLKTSDVGVDVSAEAVLSAKLIAVNPFDGKEKLEGKRLGGVTLDNGILQSRGGTKPFISYNGSSSGPGIELLAGGGVIDTQEYNVTNHVVVYGEGALRKIGSGSLTLAAENIHTGETIVSGGTLVVASGASLAGGVTVKEGAALTVEDSSAVFSSFTIEKGGAVNVPEFDGDGMDLFSVSSKPVIEETMKKNGKTLYSRQFGGRYVVRYGVMPGFIVIVR